MIYVSICREVNEAQQSCGATRYESYEGYSTLTCVGECKVVSSSVRIRTKQQVSLTLKFPQEPLVAFIFCLFFKQCRFYARVLGCVISEEAGES